MTYYGNLTDEQRIERIRKEAARAENRYKRVREEWLPKLGLQDTRTLNEVLYADADHKVWDSVVYYLDIPGAEREEQTAAVKIERARKHVRREVQGWSGSRSSDPMTNLARAIEHETWIEAAELLDPSW